MTQSNKRSVWALCIWGPVAVAFVILFFFVGKPATYADTQSVRIMVGVIFAVGYVSYAVMLYLTRVKAGKQSLITDERDELIGMQGANTGMIFVLVYVFILAIYLWENYQTQGAVPVGWMWFLAYSTSLMAFLSSSATTLVLHWRSNGHG